MRLFLPYALVLLAFSSSMMAACTADNPNFCDGEDQCGADSVCDLARKECVAPTDVLVECESSTECTRADEPICDEALSLCRACSEGEGGDAECRDLGLGATLCLEGACVECASATDCAAETPSCSDQNTCELCDVSSGGDEACAARDDGALPLCGAEGRCVECRDNGDCDSTLCDGDSGTCVDVEAVVFVDLAGTDSATCGAFGGTPCQTLGGPQGALAKLVPDDGRIYVRLAPGIYEENVEIFELTAILMGDGAELKSDADGFPVLRVADSDVEVRGLTLRGGSPTPSAHGVACTANSPRSLRLDGVTVELNSGRGVAASGCDVSITSSTLRNNVAGGVFFTNGALEIASSDITSNAGGGVRATEASSVVIVNNFLTRNGNAGASVGALLIETGDSTSPSTFEFNTIVANRSRGILESGAIVDCSSLAITATHNLIYDNTLDDGPQVVGICPLSFSNVEGGTTTNGNIDEQPVFVDASGGDYHLAPGSPGIDQGAESSAITVDIDGDVRPQGARLDIGADEVPVDALISTGERQISLSR